MKTHRRQVILFTRSPRAESRAKGFPVRAGTRLFGKLVSLWIEAARSVDATAVLASPQASVRELQPLPLLVEPQSGRSFGEGLENAFDHGFSRGAVGVVLVGGDSPPPSHDVLKKVFERLESEPTTLVLEPSPDGGVNLIGAARPLKGFFSGIPWFSPRVAVELLTRGKNMGFDVLMLPAIIDLDHRLDIARAHLAGRFDPIWKKIVRWLSAVLESVRTSDPLALIAPSQLFLFATPSRAPPLLRFQ